jgi:hypothetical protein
MSERIHGLPSSMTAYRPEGPAVVAATGPVSGPIAGNANFTARDQAAEQNLVRYMSDARQGADEFRTTVNRNGGEYETTDLFNGSLFDLDTGTGV